MKGTEKMRLQFAYKGYADAKNQVVDEYLAVALTDGNSRNLAEAVVNFPVLDGKKYVFVHDLFSEKEKWKVRLLEKIEDFAKKRGYAKVYIRSGKQEPKFLEEKGFVELPDRGLAEKEMQ